MTTVRLRMIRYLRRFTSARRTFIREVGGLDMFGKGSVREKLKSVGR